MRAPGDRTREIALGQDPDQAAVVRDRSRADLPVYHLLRGLADRVLRGHGQNVARHQVGEGAHRKREHRRKRRNRLLRVQPCVLEVEIARDPLHDVVVDSAFAAKRDHRCPLGIEQLAQEPLVRLRLLLDRSVVVV